MVMNCGDLSPSHVRKWYGFSSSTLGMAFGTPDRKENAVRGSPRCFNPEIWAGECYGISVRHYPRFQNHAYGGFSSSTLDTKHCLVAFKRFDSA